MPEDLTPDRSAAPDADGAGQRERFLQQLPWWLNRTLDDAASAWMDAAVQRWPWAAQAARREAALLQGLAAPEPADPTLGLQALLARVNADAPQQANPGLAQPGGPPAGARAPAADPAAQAGTDHPAGPGVAAAPGGRGQPARAGRPPSPTRPSGAWLHALLGWLSGPRLGPALALVVLAQAGLIVWMGAIADGDDTAMRSTPVTEMRTLRVTPAPGLTEAQWRAALLASGAHIVGGPTQLGEYWLASDMRSLAEVQAQLQAAGVVTQADVDREGPRGR